MSSNPEQDPRYHTQNLQKRLQELVQHLREDVTKVNEPQFKAMCETAAEVLLGLAKAFQDYEHESEAVWKR